MSILDPFLAAFLLLVAALVQGFFGFGFGMAAMSALSFGGDLVHAAGVVNVAGGLLTVWMAWSLRGHVLWALYLRVAFFLAIGVVIGVTALDRLDRQWMVGVLGVFVVAISLWNAVAPRLATRESRVADGVAGLVGGFFGGAFNTGGPPLVVHVYRRHEPPDALKATIQLLFLSISLIRLPVAAIQGQIDASVLRDAALATPVVIAGAWIGMWIARRVDPERFRRACWIGLAGLGMALLASL